MRCSITIVLVRLIRLGKRDKLKTYIHIGYPKNASTTMQTDIFPNIEGACYIGRLYGSGKKFLTPNVQEAMRLIATSDSVDFSKDNVQKRMKNSIRKMAGENEKLIISWEAFTNNVSDRGLMAERLKCLFPEAKILIVIRNQMDALRSMYSFMVRERGENINISYGRPSVASFEQWIADQEAFLPRSYLLTLRYYELISYYWKLFGKDNTTVLFFEDLVRSPDKFFEQLACYFDVESIGYASKPSEPKRNKSPSGKALSYYRLRGALPNVQLSKFLPKVIAHRWHEFLSNNSGKHAGPELPPVMRERIMGMYREGNRKLQHELQRNLADLGYVV